MSAAVVSPAPIPGAPAEFCGWQEWPGRAPLELWNLTEDFGGHCARSTLSREAIEQLVAAGVMRDVRAG